MPYKASIFAVKKGLNGLHSVVSLFKASHIIQKNKETKMNNDADLHPNVMRLCNVFFQLLFFILAR